MKVFEYEPTTTKPPEFTLAGEIFVCASADDVSSMDVLDYLAGMTGGSGITRIQTIVALFKQFIPEGEMERFRKTVRTGKVPLSVVNDIASWTLDEYLGFPTPAAESQSSNGSPAAVSSNVDGSSVPPDVTSPG
jgi:hypothetical protein